MPAYPQPTTEVVSLRDRTVFLSASIPDPDRWEGAFDPREITDAVVAAARVILTAEGTLVTAAHPTIAPLLLYVAAEIATTGSPPSVIVYQSNLFSEILPEPTHRFEADGVGELRWTPAVEGEIPEPGRWDASLRLMRRRMLNETSPAAAIFVGGMEGIAEEFALFRELFPARPVYPVGAAGGEARALVARAASPVSDLLDGNVYPALFRRVVDDLVAHLDG